MTANRQLDDIEDTLGSIDGNLRNMNARSEQLAAQLNKVQEDTVAIRIQQAVTVEQALTAKKHVSSLWIAVLVLASQLFPSLAEPLKKLLGMIAS